jgi:hypothetical protein
MGELAQSSTQKTIVVWANFRFKATSAKGGAMWTLEHRITYVRTTAQSEQPDGSRLGNPLAGSHPLRQAATRVR